MLISQLREARKSQKGFSLIELMVVVAIIGILAAIAMPNFARFRAKSRQSEAKAHLTGIHMAQKSFFAEWGAFFSEPEIIGYAPEGALLYNASLGAANTVSNSMDGLILAVPGVAGNPIGYAGPASVGRTELDDYCRNAPMASCTAGAAVVAIAAFPTPLSAVPLGVNVAAHMFVAVAATTPALLGTNGLQNDVWSINENKQIFNELNGL